MEIKFTEEQQAVIDARNCNILVSAAAGSGKTAVLVERIIQLISNPERELDIDHILVVTFTKAAAAQMKEKIAAAISKKIEQDPLNAHLQKQEQLVHNAQITTIDSFCQYVIRNNFNDIDLDPGFRVADEGELKMVRTEVLENLLEEEYENASEDFLFCGEFFATGSDDRQLCDMIMDLYGKSISMPWPKEWLHERAHDYELGEQSFEDMPEIVEAKNYYKRRMAAFVKMANKCITIANEPDGPYMYGDLLESELEQIQKATEADTYDACRTALKNINFDRLPSKKDPSVNADKRELVKSIRNEIKEELGKKLSDDWFAQDSKTIMTSMAGCDRAVKELIRLSIRFMDLYDAAKREQNVIDFSDMEHMALKVLLKSPEETGSADAFVPTEAALEYRAFFKEVMIDEYQDSNNVQEMLLRAVSGDDPSVCDRFMVGDVKQSIYKFRLARPEIFMDKMNSFKQDAQAIDRRIDLHKNFRSRPEVLEFTNYVFKRIMGRDLGGVDYDQDAMLALGKDISGDDPDYNYKPEILLIPEPAEDAESLEDSDIDLGDKLQREAAVVADQIRQIIAEDRYHFKDIVILMRSTAKADVVFKKVLESRDIPTYVESKAGYFDTSEIVTLLSFLSCIDNPLQDIPLAAVMHSPLFGFTDEELASLKAFAGKEYFGEHFFYVLKHFAQEGDAEDLQEKAQRFYETLNMYREMAVYTPVVDLLQKVMDDTDYLSYVTALPQGRQRRANIDFLMEKAADYERTNFKGLFHFVRYIEDIKSNAVDFGEVNILDENADVVRIMSIHKSKGLEFPVVFVSGLSKKYNLMDSNGRFIADVDGGIGVKYVDPKRRITMETIRRKAVARKITTDCVGEELRVLYVALTRAKEKLYLTATIADPQKAMDTIMAKQEFIFTHEYSDQPELISYDSRESLKSYGDLILTAMCDEGADAYAQIREVHADELISSMTSEDIKTGLRKEKLGDIQDVDIDGELLKRLTESMDRRYAYSALKGLYTKTTVTELKEAALISENEQSIRAFEYQEEEEKIIPTFIKAAEVARGAQRGTAYHKIMEILDEGIYGHEELMQMIAGDDQGVGALITNWIKDKIAAGMITPDYLDIIRPIDIIRFLQTEIGRRMREAFLAGSLYREKQFMMGLPASLLKEEYPAEEIVLVQGAIDAWFIEDGEIVLVDYKTDRVKAAQDLADKYHVQLDYYADALRRITGLNVKQKFIYSFHLGCQLEVK